MIGSSQCVCDRESSDGAGGQKQEKENLLELIKFRSGLVLAGVALEFALIVRDAGGANSLVGQMFPAAFFADVRYDHLGKIRFHIRKIKPGKVQVGFHSCGIEILMMDAA